MLFTKKIEGEDYKVIARGKVQEYLLAGIEVFMVMKNGTVQPITTKTPSAVILMHSITRGVFAIRNIENKGFNKEFNIFGRRYTITHQKNEEESKWVFEKLNIKEKEDIQ